MRWPVHAPLLRQISEPGRLKVLVVEDLHWADEATVDLVRFLGRRLKGAPVLRLFISVKTTHHHVSAILGKLGTSSRGAAAAEAIRLGLVTPGKS